MPRAAPLVMTTENADTGGTKLAHPLEDDLSFTNVQTQPQRGEGSPRAASLACWSHTAEPWLPATQ